MNCVQSSAGAHKRELLKVISCFAAARRRLNLLVRETHDRTAFFFCLSLKGHLKTAFNIKLDD